jgi:hypothetical protein
MTWPHRQEDGDDGPVLVDSPRRPDYICILRHPLLLILMLRCGTARRTAALKEVMKHVVGEDSDLSAPCHALWDTVM